MRISTILTTAALLAGLALPTAAENGERILNGTFTSGFQDHPKAVRAVFRPTEEGDWEVAFFFEFNGSDHEYAGSAEGTIGEGALRGKVESDGNGGRIFTFEGEFKKGVFKGTHAEITRGGSQRTGTLTLKG